MTLFLATNPQSAGLLGILSVVVALYGFCWGLALLICGLLFSSRRHKTAMRKKLKTMNNGQVIEISAVLALAPVLIIVLNSLGTIGVIELVLVVCFESVMVFLIRKKR
jgi:hypothetical protein